MNAVGSAALAARFEDEAPGYPTFPAYWTRESRPQAVQDALRWIAGPRKTQQGAKVLDALELLDGDRLDPSRSRYAEHVVELLGNKGEGQVLNRGELIHTVHDVEYMAPGTYRLEPDWVVVVLASLVYSGDLVLAIPGRKFDATDVAALPATPLTDLVGLKHVERPKSWNIPALTALFELLELTPGMAQLVAQGKEQPVQELQKAIDARVKRLVIARQALQAGFQFWGRGLLDDYATDDLRGKLDAAKNFLESLQAFTSPGTLKNFPLRSAGGRGAASGPGCPRRGRGHARAGRGLRECRIVFSRGRGGASSRPQVGGDAEGTCVRTSSRSSSIRRQRSATGFRQQVQRKLGDLKRAYVDAYLVLHARARLGVDDDRRKGRLLKDERLQQMRNLATIDLMPRQQLTDFQHRLAALKSCFALTEQDLDAAADCPHCAFRPSAEPVQAPAGNVLAGLDGELDTLTSTWTGILLNNLEDPTTRDQLELLGPNQRDLVQAFIASGTLPRRRKSRLHRRARAGAVRPLEGGGHRRGTPPRALPERIAGDAERAEEALRRLRRRKGEGNGRGESTDRDRVIASRELPMPVIVPTVLAQRPVSFLGVILLLRFLQTIPLLLLWTLHASRRDILGSVGSVGSVGDTGNWSPGQLPPRG